MPFHRYDYKVAYLDALLRPYADRPIRLADLGSGASDPFVEILPRYPNVTYTGVEPDRARRAKAARALAGLPKVTLIGATGEALTTQYADAFDLTLSLSVLEHVKYLRSFLRTSVQITTPGGRIVHRYDLGHAFYPQSFRERLILWACHRTPGIVPTRRFTTKPDSAVIQQQLAAEGVRDLRVSYGQMYSLKHAMNRLDWIAPDAHALAAQILATDAALAAHLGSRLSREQMERLFLVVAIEGIKGHGAG